MWNKSQRNCVRRFDRILSVSRWFKYRNTPKEQISYFDGWGEPAFLRLAAWLVAAGCTFLEQKRIYIDPHTQYIILKWGAALDMLGGLEQKEHVIQHVCHLGGTAIEVI